MHASFRPTGPTPALRQTMASALAAATLALAVVAALRDAALAADSMEAEAQGRAMEVIPLSVTPCPDRGRVNATNTVRDFAVTRVSSTAHGASMRISIPWSVATISKANVKFTQCPLDQPCKHFYNMRFSQGVCRLVEDRQAFWSPIFAGCQPPFRCPLEKGTFFFRNSTVNMDQFLRLFTGGKPPARREAVWNSRIEVFDEQNNEFLCLIVKLKYA